MTLTRPHASQIAYTSQDYVADVPTHVDGKLSEVVHIAEFGVLGNGTNERIQLQKALDASVGRRLILEPGKTYGFSAGLLTIPAGVTLVTRGSKFKVTNNPSDWVMNVMAGVTIDRLELEFTGDANTRGIRILGGNVSIGQIVVTAANAQTGQGNVRRRAVRVGTDESPRIANVRIGSIYIKNFDYGFAAHSVDNLQIGFIEHDTFVGSVWLEDVRHSRIDGGAIYGTSASVLGAAGENGILMSNTPYHGHHSTTNVHIANVSVEGSGEHGYRLGGQYVISNVTFHACKAKRTGQGTGVEHGGSGFKALGPTNLSQAGAYHQDIRYIDCVVEDVDITSATANNYAGFNIGKCWGVSIVNPIVRTSIKNQTSDPTVPPTISCVNGIEIIGCRYVSITNPLIQAPRDNGIYLYDIVDAGNDWGVRNEWISVEGGAVNAPGENGVHLDILTMDFRRIRIADLQVEGGKRHTYLTSTGGTLAVLSVGGHYIPGGSTTATIEGLGNARVDMSGGFSGTNACLNGSRFQDFTNGLVKIRKAGAWTDL